MNPFLQALFMSFSMLYQVFWSLILGFILSSLITVLIPQTKIQQALGKDGLKQTAFATFLGAISSSCSYAAVSTSHSLFKKGAAFIPSLAFLFASTNLVIELGLILYFLMGWQFTLAEWAGGIILIAILAIIVKVTYPKKLIIEARSHQEKPTHHPPTTQTSLKAIADNFVMEISMLRNDLILGFLIAGALAVFIPENFWHLFLLNNQPDLVKVVLGALIGPIIAVLSFVCSIGNVPLAAVLWSKGLGFSGVLSFLYADLIVIPLLDIYRKYYGGKLALYLGAVFFISMVISGIIVYLPFKFLNQIPLSTSNLSLPTYQVNYTFWLNLIFLGLAVFLFIKSRFSKT